MSGYKTLAGESDGLHCCNAGLHMDVQCVKCRVQSVEGTVLGTILTVKCKV